MISGTSSHVSIGRTPAASAKIVTTIRFRHRLKNASSTIDNGMTMRGNWIFLTSISLSTTLRTAPTVDSLKKVNNTIDARSWAP